MPEAEGKQIFLSCKVSFSRLGSLGLGDFVSNIASKMHETSLHLGGAIVVLQLQKFLCKREETGQLVVVVREMQNTVCKDIVGSGDQTDINLHQVVDHEAALQASKNFPFGLFFAPLIIQALGVTLLVKIRREGNGS